MTGRFLAGTSVLLFALSCVSTGAAETASLGKPAPDFTATGIDGKPFKLSEKTATGKNVVLMFSRAHW